jgi:MoxR-like ATPase
VTENVLTPGTLIKITRENGRFYTATTSEGINVTDALEPFQKKNAFKNGKALCVTEAANGIQLRQVPMSEFEEKVRSRATEMQTKEMTDAEMKEFLKTCTSLRPATYKISDILWKFMIRSVLRGKNLLFKGPQGCGKTSGVFALAQVLERPFFNIPLGASQDARSTLVGNVHFKEGEGTYVSDSLFVHAIQTENAVILLDEITRAHPDASNILMSVLDAKQRFLRMDEKPDTPVIHVADGVTFMATANMGHQFSGTRTMDAALLDRFEVIEVEPLDKDGEIALLNLLVPNQPTDVIAAIASIAAATRVEVKSESPKLANIVSTRQTIRLAELTADGFTLEEACEVVIYPFFSEAGGAESERAMMKQIVQRFLPSPYDKKDSPFQSNAGKLPWET